MIIHCKLNNSSGKVYNIHILWHVSGDSRIQKLFWSFAVLVIWHCGSDFAQNVTRNKECLHNYQFLLSLRARGHGLFSIWLSFHFCWRKKLLIWTEIPIVYISYDATGYKLAQASVQGRVVLTRKMFLGRPGRRRQ